MVHDQLAGSPLVQKTLEEGSGSEEESETRQTGNTRAASLRATLLGEPNLVLAIREEITRELEDLGAGRTFRGIEWYLPYFYTRPASLLEHLPENGLLAIDDGEQVAASLKASEDEAARTYLELTRGYELPGEFHSSFFSSETLLPQIAACKPLVLGANGLPGEPVESESSALARLFVPSPTICRPNQAHSAGDAQVCKILRPRRAHLETDCPLQEELREAQVPSNLIPELDKPPRSGISLLQGVLPEGFVMNGPADPEDDGNGLQPAGLRLFTDSELFGWIRQPRQQRRRSQSTVAPNCFLPMSAPTIMSFTWSMA